MSIEREYNKQIDEALQLEAAGFTKADIEEMDRRYTRRNEEPSIPLEDFLKEIGYEG
jgi:hypothetical protein